MPRTHVVTGAGSGIGKALAQRLRQDGHTVIGVDLRGADVTVDLSSRQGRDAMVAQVSERTGGVLDSVVAVAGRADPVPGAAAINYFGTIATLEGLRPLLCASPAPRAAVVASLALIEPVDDRLFAALLEGDEGMALAIADEIAGDAVRGGSNTIYNSSKRAIALWVRKNAPTGAWAGASIPLNAVAPGVVDTPMTAPALATEEGRALLNAGAPSPLNGPAAPPSAPANLLAWLVSEENTNMTGQVLFLDGGAESMRRPELV